MSPLPLLHHLTTGRLAPVPRDRRRARTPCRASRAASLSRVDTWRGGLAGSQVVERCPVTKGPGADSQLNDPHGVTLNFQGPVLAKERQNMIADWKRPIVAE